MKKPDHPILYGTIASVLATAIYALLTLLVPGLYHWTLNAGLTTWQFLTGASHIPRWLLFVLAVVAVPTVWQMIRFCLPTKSLSSAVRQPQITDYTEDALLGVVWRWIYRQGRITDIVAFCPTCDTQLGYNEPYVGICVSLVCDHCRQVVYSGEGGLEDTLNKAARQIERKIRSGEWKAVLVAKSEGHAGPS